jgi:hypothetical protein
VSRSIIAMVIGAPLAAALATGRFRGQRVVVVFVNALVGPPPVVVWLAHLPSRGKGAESRLSHVSNERAVLPKSANCALIFRIREAELISLLSFSTIFGGCPWGHGHPASLLPSSIDTHEERRNLGTSAPEARDDRWLVSSLLPCGIVPDKVDHRKDSS